MIKQISLHTLEELREQAEASPRLRTNLNFHPTTKDAVQRLAIAMQPGTYVRAHHHPNTWELLTVLKGRFSVLIYNQERQVTQRIVLGEDTRVLEMPVNCWHSVLSLDDGGVIFEVKQGEYIPLREEDYLPGSVPEGDARTSKIMAWYAQAQRGDIYPE